MSKNKTFTGPLAEHIRNFLNEKRTLGYKYEEQERVFSVLDRMSQQFDCSNGLPKDLCLAFIQRDPNWKQRTQEQRVALIRAFAEYLIRHEIPAYLVDFSIVTKRNEDFKPYIFTHSQINDIFNAADSIPPHSSDTHIFYPAILRVQYRCGLRMIASYRGREISIKEHTDNVFNALDAFLAENNLVNEYTNIEVGNYIRLDMEFEYFNFDRIESLFEQEFLDRLYLELAEENKNNKMDLMEIHSKLPMLKKLIPYNSFLYGKDMLILLTDDCIRGDAKKLGFIFEEIRRRKSNTGNCAECFHNFICAMGKDC